MRDSVLSLLVTPLQPVHILLLTTPANEAPIIQNWAKHKKNIVIASGLNRNISLIHQQDWDILRSTSNHVEQAAKKSYSYGKGLHLLPAIKM